MKKDLRSFVKNKSRKKPERKYSSQPSQAHNDTQSSDAQKQNAAKTQQSAQNPMDQLKMIEQFRKLSQNNASSNPLDQFKIIEELQKGSTGTSSTNESNNLNDQIKAAQDAQAKYANKNESELMSELMQKVHAQKQDGTFSIDALEQFASNSSSMLNDEQRKKMQDIINQLR